MEILTIRDRGLASSANDFHNRVTGRKRTPAQWEWTFWNGPSGAGTYLACVSGSRIVGTQAMMPITMRDCDGLYLTAKSEETQLAKELRGKGILSALYAHLLAADSDPPIDSIWGFTAATKALRNAGFATMGDLEVMTLDLRPHTFNDKSRLRRLSKVARSALRSITANGAATVRRARVAHGSSTNIRPVSAPLSEGSELTERFVRTWGGTTIERSAEYLDWRIFENPWARERVLGAYVDGALVGWLIYTIDETAHSASIVDLLVAVDESRSEAPIISELLVLRCMQESRRAGAKTLDAWIFGNHPFSRQVAHTLKRLRFVSNQGMTAIQRSALGETEQQRFSFEASYVTRIWSDGSGG